MSSTSADQLAPAAPGRDGPPSTGRCCVFWLDSGCYALDVALVGEVVPATPLTVLPRCHAAILGLANLRGHALAVIDLAAVLGLPAGAGPRQTGQHLVLSTAVRLAGAAITRVEGVFRCEPSAFRSANRLAEPAWVAGFQSFPSRPDLVATLISSADLLARLDHLRYQRPAVAGIHA